MSNNIYCVYLTTYSGVKLPPKYATSTITPTLYIGSSRIDRIEKGYKGSVSSKKYHKIWKQELKENPNLFTIEILQTLPTRRDALAAELLLQIEHNVVKNEKYVNMALAKKNGYCGMNTSGQDHPMYGIKGKDHYNFGKIRSEEFKRNKKLETIGEKNPMYGKKHKVESLQKMKEKKLGKNNPQFGKNGTMLNKHHSDETIEKMKHNNGGKNNPRYGKRKYEMWVYEQIIEYLNTYSMKQIQQLFANRGINFDVNYMKRAVARHIQIETRSKNNVINGIT